MESDSRFAELATELIGAKAAAEFLREAWAMADDETKRVLASAVVDRVRKDIAKDSFEYRNEMGGVLRQLIEKEVTAEIEKRRVTDERWLEARVRDKLDGFLDETVDSIVRKAAEEICQKVRDRVSGALRGVR